MKTNEIKELFAKFESIVCDYNGVECWSARELYKLLGYTQWRNFLPAVEKAKKACKGADEEVSYHFADVSKMVDLGSGSQRSIDTILLTRYACYLVAQNGDSRGHLKAVETLSDFIYSQIGCLYSEQQEVYCKIKNCYY